VKDRIYDYLEDLGDPASSEAIASEVLRLKGATGAVADRIVAAAVEADRRFLQVGDGMWTLGRAPVVPTLEQAVFLAVGTIMSPPQSGNHATVLELSACRVGLNAPPERLPAVDTTGPEAAAGLAAFSAFSEGSTAAAFRYPRIRARLNHLSQGMIGDSLVGPGLCLHRLGRRAFPDQSLPDVSALARVTEVAYVTDRDAMGEAELQADVLLRLLETYDPSTTVDELAADLYPPSLPTDFESYAFDEAFLSELPEAPGVYIMRDQAGSVIYVGKSVSLRDRVGHYFARRTERPEKTRRILDRIWSMEVQTVGSEAEALVVEGRLIRACRPEFNTQLTVHERPDHAPLPDSCVLLLPSSEEDCVELFCLVSGRPYEQIRARRDLADWSGRSKELRGVLFETDEAGEGPSEDDAADIELLRSWYTRNREHVNCVDVSDGKDPDDGLRVLRDYVAEFETGETERVWRV
jgi:hypothetical protein